MHNVLFYILYFCKTWFFWIVPPGSLISPETFIWAVANLFAEISSEIIYLFLLKVIIDKYIFTRHWFINKNTANWFNFLKKSLTLCFLFHLSQSSNKIKMLKHFVLHRSLSESEQIDILRKTRLSIQQEKYEEAVSKTIQWTYFLWFFVWKFKNIFVIFIT